MNAKALTNQCFTLLASTLFLIMIIFASRVYAADHNVFITLVSGSTEQILPNHSANLYEQLDDGSAQRIKSLTSDNQGVIPLTLAGLEQGQRYYLKTKSPFDGRTKKSNLITSAGASTFTVGNQLLNVTLSSGIDNSLLPLHQVVVYQRLDDNSRKFIQTVITDSNAQLNLDLPGLGSGITYVLRTKHIHGSGLTYSDDLHSTSNFTFKVGNTRIKTINGIDNTAFSEQTIKAYLRDSEGKRTWVATYKTDTSGLTDFQLPALTAGQYYQFKASNLNDGRSWYSDPINQFGLSTFIIGNKALKVTVSSGIDNSLLPLHQVVVYQRLDDNSRKFIQTVTTDNNAQLSLYLPGLGSDKNYVLRTQHQHGSGRAYSNDIHTTGNFSFKVGNTRIKAINGIDNTAFSEQTIKAYLRDTDGKNTWLASYKTDNSGLADFQLPALTAGQYYQFKATNQNDGRSWYSDSINQFGLSTFIVGNKTLKVTVSSGIDNSLLPLHQVVVYQRLDDNSRKFIQTVTTDNNAQLKLELPGLGSGKNYVLRTKQIHGSGRAYSNDIHTTGNFSFKVGNIRIKAINGIDNTAFSEQTIKAYLRDTDGKNTWLASYKTDNSGLADFQLPALTVGQYYQFKATNQNDGRSWYSDSINQFGLSTFIVGNKTLNITVTSGIDNSPLSNQPIVLYQLLSDGRRKGLRTLSTDNNGLLKIELPGLGTNTNYQLRTLPKHGSRAIYSNEINSTGNFEFKVGNVRVKVVDGRTNNIIDNHKITVYKYNQDGSKTWFTYATTDISGQADFLLPNLAIGQKYTFKAASLSDGLTWNSDVISSPGSSTFVIGNKLLNVTVTSGIDSTPLANQAVTIYQKLTDESRKYIRTATTDNNGFLALDLAGLGNGTHYELRTLPKHGSRHIYSKEINSTGSFSFKVANVRIKAINGQTNSIIANHKISAYKYALDGSLTWFTSANTDPTGFADFQLENINTQHYIFKAATPDKGQSWSSNLITTAGTSTFIIGNKLLNVAVTSGIDETPLANQAVNIYQLLTDGSRKSIQTAITNNSGLLSLDLPGLGNGNYYQLRTLPQHGSRQLYSGEINTTGNFSFKVANVRVKAINGQSNKIISDHRVNVYQYNTDGTTTWVTSSNTDSSGFADLQLANLPTQQYLFKAVSLSNGRTWTSNAINTTGISTFIIGNKLLNVSLVNALDNKPLPNIEVVAYLRMADNSLKWSQKETTDSNGQLKFDLKGLGSDRQYVLSTRPYGVKLLSKDINETGDFKIQAGAIAVTLRQKDNNSIMVGRTLYLFEKVSPGKTEWRATSKTDANGKVYFDPRELGSGKIFFIKGKNLFGNNKDYYSQWIASKGQLNFIVSPDDSHKLDEEAPSFNQFNPTDNAVLADKGFTLKMLISDNNTVENVNIRIIDPVKGTTSGPAFLLNKEWQFSVTASMISKDQTITVKAEAFDKTGNKSSVSYQYSIIDDTEKPNLTINSHQTGDQIDENGFFITGTVIDNTGYVKLLATVIDPIKGIIIDHKELDIGSQHHWALVAKDLSRDQDIIINLEATDSAANVTNSQIILAVITENSSMIQLINRITYGATPELLKELREFGTDNFIESQLHPELIDDSNFEQKLAGLFMDETSIYRKLHNSQIARAIGSKRQLLEVMTQFWESHFNTDLGTTNSSRYEKREQDLFRQNAMGNFRDLLQISAKSPAMLIYLDNIFNFKDLPNENYAREIMELHTLGVDNEYTDQDITEVARVFTGWRVSSNQFFFSASRHDDGEKIVLGTTIPSGLGVDGGEMVLDLLAEHPATAQFICTKLLHKFVSDTPTSSAINLCATDFIAYNNEDNQLALVLDGIFKSTDFSNSLNFHNKVKTPLEFIVGIYRQLPVTVSYPKTRVILSSMGMPLFYYALPTGWPELANDLVNSSQVMQRWQFSNNVLFDKPSQWKNYIVTPHTFFIEKGIETTEGILGYLFEITLAHDYSELEWNEALFILTNQQTEKFNIYGPDAELKIRNVIAMMLQYPSYQLQ